MPKEQIPSSENDFSPEDREMMGNALWYIKAREKVESFLADIDPNLEVDIQRSIVTPDDPKKSEYSTDTLIFTHKTQPELRWTMEIEKSDNYINNRLEDIVRKVYERDVKG